jgi:hypothetical protein
MAMDDSLYCYYVGHLRDKVTKRRKLNNVELHNLHYSSNIIQAGGPGFGSWQGWGSFLITESRQALGPTQSPTQWVLRFLPWQ